MLRPLPISATPNRVDRLQDMACAALRAYDLPGAQLTPLCIFNNAVFQVDVGHGQRYVLRLHRPGYRSISHTRSELRYLQSLRWDTGLAVPEPIYTRQGELVTVVSGDGADTSLHCDVLTWLDGTACGRATELGPVRYTSLARCWGVCTSTRNTSSRRQTLTCPAGMPTACSPSVSPHKPGPVTGNFLTRGHGGLDHRAGHLASATPAVSDSTPVRLKQGGDLDILSYHDTEARNEKGGCYGNHHPIPATKQP